MSRNPPKSPAQVAERRARVIALSADAALTYQGIALKVGLSQSRVRAILAEEGIQRKPNRRMGAGELERARQLLEGGASLAETARTIGRPPQTLNYYFKGWSRTQCGEWTAFCNRAFGHFDPFTGEQSKPGATSYVEQIARHSAP